MFPAVEQNQAFSLEVVYEVYVRYFEQQTLAADHNWPRSAPLYYHKEMKVLSDNINFKIRNQNHDKKISGIPMYTSIIKVKLLFTFPAACCTSFECQKHAEFFVRCCAEVLSSTCISADPTRLFHFLFMLYIKKDYI